jgi:hypothetical protein
MIEGPTRVLTDQENLCAFARFCDPKGRIFPVCPNLRVQVEAVIHNLKTTGPPEPSRAARGAMPSAVQERPSQVFPKIFSDCLNKSFGRQSLTGHVELAPNWPPSGGGRWNPGWSARD